MNVSLRHSLSMFWYSMMWGGRFCTAMNGMSLYMPPPAVRLCFILDMGLVASCSSMSSMLTMSCSVFSRFLRLSLETARSLRNPRSVLSRRVM